VSDESPEGSALQRLAGFAREVGSPAGKPGGEEPPKDSSGKIVFAEPVTGGPPAPGGPRGSGGLIPYRKADRAPESREEKGEGPPSGEEEGSREGDETGD
jgi:hypothetical protein